MSYLADNMIKVADRYGLSGSVQEGDDVVTFTSDDKSLQIIGRHEIEAVLSVMVNGKPFDLEDGASIFSEHAIEMAVERLMKGRKVVEACVAALSKAGWTLNVSIYDWIDVIKGDKKAQMYVSCSHVRIYGSNRQTIAKVLYDAGILQSHKQVPGWSGIYALAENK